MSTTITKTIANNVRAELARRERSHRELAALLGISTTALSRRMVGAKPFTVSELGTLAAAFDIPLSAIISDRDQIPAAPESR